MMTVPRPRWHLLYFVLAGFDLLTVSISLYLNHRLGRMYADSVAVTQTWAERLGRYGAIGETATEVNTAANDVFESRDVVAETRRMERSLDLFLKLVAAARADLESHVAAPQAARLLQHLDEVRVAMTAQVDEGRRVFRSIDDGDLLAAGASMARMDRQHARLGSILNRLRTEVATIQAAQLADQSVIADSLKLLEYAIGAAILTMVIATALYGHHLARQATAAAQAREQQMAMVSQIATGVAHEIRNPLTAIKMLLQAGREQSVSARVPGGGLAPEDFDILEGEIRRMERCLNTFLDFARLPRPRHEEFELNALIERTFRLIQGRADRQNVALLSKLPPEPTRIMGDREQIQQILLNLALNALEAMPNGGKIELTVSEREGEVELCMTDSGPGISPAIRSRLFDPFVTTKEAGMGLGLIISRRIAEEHGGSLVETGPNERGACFVLRMPTHATSPTAVAESALAARSGNGAQG